MTRAVLRSLLRENAHVRRDLFVVLMPGDGEERFAFLWRDRLPIEQLVRSRTIEDAREAFRYGRRAGQGLCRFSGSTR